MSVKQLVLKCTCCNKEINESFLEHNISPTHLFNYYVWSYGKKRKALAKDKEGIKLQICLINKDDLNVTTHFSKNKGKYQIDIELEHLAKVENTLEFKTVINNDRSEESIFLTAASVLDAASYSLCYDDQTNWMTTNNIVEIKPKQTYKGVRIKFLLSNLIIGSFKVPVTLNFQDEKGKRAITICRVILINIVDKLTDDENSEEIKKSPFTDNRWDNKEVLIIPANCKMVVMNNYPIPRGKEKFYWHAFTAWQNITPTETLILEDLKNTMNPGYVTLENYRVYFHNCLWLEECVNTLMLYKYNMENVFMSVINGNELKLEVPGLAEKRPSLIVGDRVNIRTHEDHTGYEGYISIIEDRHIIIKYVNPELVETIMDDEELELDVCFKLGRLPFERGHRGIDYIFRRGIQKSLFPDKLKFNSYIEHHKLSDSDFINKNIAKNLEQKTAVVKILNQSSGEAPYIVFGPPGTGKTVTIVEAIIQILNRTKKKILICAPANAACDMLASKLIPLCDTKELLRVHSETRDKSTITDEIRDYSNMTKDGDFLKISAKDLNKYRIVVSTLMLSGKYYGGDYNPDVLVVDEAAQALEPDVCVALGLLKCKCQIVLAGDPKQLGPIVHSRVAQKYGLDISLLERLMDTQKLYADENPNFITMLKKNFRSHPDILDIPNALFYDSKLEPVSKKPMEDQISKIVVYRRIKKMNQSFKIQVPLKSKYALEFCAISSKEQREGRSPSYFNLAEAKMVIEYIKTLINMKLPNKVLQSDIGVITPYVRQVYKIKGLLKNIKLEEIEVGSTEAFQGREKRIIIISTVRAQHNLLKHDTKYALGFVRQDKRFNVAITRAISKLIIIGCPSVLCKDDKWKSFMDRCSELESYHGAPFEERNIDKINEIVERFRKFSNF